MSDIIQDLADVLADMDDGIPRDLTQKELYLLLSRAVGAIDSRDREIERLRKELTRQHDHFTGKLVPDLTTTTGTDYEDVQPR